VTMMKTIGQKLAWSVGVWMGLLGVGVLLSRYGPDAAFFPKCLLHRFSGFHCPGCGMTRAAYAVIHGDVSTAFWLNPLWMVLLPVACLLAVWKWWGWLRGRPVALPWLSHKWMAWGGLAVLLAFGVLRNIPHWPFSLLAPP